MARAEIEKQIMVVLTLDEDEADYLTELLQNYLGGGEEPSDDQELRHNLFTALKNAMEEE